MSTASPQDCLKVFKQRLEALRLTNGAVIFPVDTVTIDGEGLSDKHFRNLPCAVVSFGDQTSDEENPELGTMEIIVDVVCFDVPATQSRSLQSKEATHRKYIGITEAVETIRAAMASFSEGGSFAQARLTDPSKANRYNVANVASSVWAQALTFEVLRG